MVEGCGYKNWLSQCREGWIYEPDNQGCVQSALCPACDGDWEGESDELPEMQKQI